MAATSDVLVFLVNFFIIIQVLCSANDTKGTLVLTQLVFRHGDRSSVTSYPNNPYEESTWPQGYGQLSKKGMRQHYELGGYFRNRYVDEHKLLNKEYKRLEVRVESTDRDRTLMSAYSNLAGFFPPGNSSEEWNPDIPWQPIPVHTRQADQDHKLNTDSTCPRYDQLYELELNSKRIRDEEKQNRAFYKFISNKTGVANESIVSIWGIFDTLYCEQQHAQDLGFKLPEWVNNTLENNITVMEKLRSLDALEFDVKFNGPLRSRLRGGPLLKDMIEHMQEKVNGSIDPKERKAFIYSAHDTTVAAFLSAMDVYNRLLPPYTATVMVELYNNSGKFAVQVLYKNESADPYVLTLPNCTELCPLEQFLEVTKSAVPDDIIAECRNEAPVISNRLTIIIAASCAIGALLLMVIITVVICRYKKNTQFSYYGIQTTA